ncbi:MAG: hypothetical protein PHE49_06705, partial [bacterium]|nr:hypothetical protein [bacterium]
MGIVLNPEVVNAVILWKKDANKRSINDFPAILGSKKNNTIAPDIININVDHNIIFDVKDIRFFD